MKIQFDFMDLWAQVRRLTNVDQPFSLKTFQHLDPIDIALSDAGVDVDLAEIEDIGSLLSYKGRQILLYIPDHGTSIDSVLGGQSEGKKFHVAHCRTLDRMRQAKRFERYVATTKLDGVFTITGSDFFTKKEVRGEAHLLVCKDCLNKLNYKQAALSSKTRHKVRNEFEITEFFETYSSCFPHLPKRDAPEKGSGAYTSDWKEVSDRVRTAAGWQCDACKIDLSTHRYLLHVHHIDGNKGNNTGANLRPLCAACHRDQPFHSSMFVKLEDMEIITRKRLDIGVLHADWDSLMQYADPALRGILGLARSKATAPPQVGLILNDPSQNHSITLDLAWPDQRKAVSLRLQSKKRVSGWTISSLSDALIEFS